MSHQRRRPSIFSIPMPPQLGPTFLVLTLLSFLGWHGLATPAHAQSGVGAKLGSAPEITEVYKIWDQGKHNAFTDLVRWRNKWYCVFREADAHVGGDGRIRVLESDDGKKWASAALVAEKGIDLRDPHISITPDDRLMLVMGGSVYKGTRTLMGRQPRVSFSKNAKTWTAPKRVLSEGEWLWRVTWHRGKAYGVAYNASARTTKEAKDAAQQNKPVSNEPADWKLQLVFAEDGVNFKTITHLGVPGHPNETTLRFLQDGTLMAMVRREGGSRNGWLGTSKVPFKEWKWTETKYRFGGPNFIQLPDGSLWGASRYYPGGAKTALASMTTSSYEPVLKLPSGGDTSYAGLAWHDGQLWMSYYASHEGKSAIYLAKIKLPAATVDIGNRLELFVDDLLVDVLKGDARQIVQKPTPREVVLTANAPWEGNTSAYFTLFQDGPIYRMYYRGSHFDKGKSTHPEVACYAESKDGIHWTKPKLGLIEFNGSKENNIVWDGVGSHNFTPFLDENPKASPDAKYKALARGRGGLFAIKSPDALNWSLMSKTPVITRGAFDSQNLAFWDPQIGKYRDFHRTFRGVRDIQTCLSDDFLNWTTPVFLRYPDAPLQHLYTNAIRPYVRAPHILLGFPTRFLPQGQHVEPTFMASRDGLTFKRYLDPVIPRTAPEDRDGNRSNYMAWGVLQLPGNDKELAVYGTEAYYAGPGSRLRRFTYRLDGFVALHAGSEGGELITRPVRFKGNKLVVNHVTAKNGDLRIELLDKEGQPLKGYSLADCKTLQGDNIAQTVTWTGPNLASLAGAPVRLRFALKNADVFSFRFE